MELLKIMKAFVAVLKHKTLKQWKFVLSAGMLLLWQLVVLELFSEKQLTLLSILVLQHQSFINKVHTMQMENLFKFTQQQFLVTINYVLMSESARGEGGRIWTYKDGKPWYFLEEKYPAYGNLVPRDIATREIFDVCVNQKLGINGENMVYLDLSHKDPHELDIKLGGIIEIYEKFTGDDPRKVPMKIFPAVHYSMGGLWVDEDQMTNIPGLFAAGECDYSQHGANRLGANSLLSAVFRWKVAGPNAVKYMSQS